MRPSRLYLLALFAILAAPTLPAISQEPAFYAPPTSHGVQLPSARYSENPGFYHYVTPCTQKSPEAPVAAPGQPALCWVVRAIRIRIVDGKREDSTPIDGTFNISSTTLQFLPSKMADADFRSSVPTSTLKFQRNTANGTALVLAKDVGYLFGFFTVCNGCVITDKPVDIVHHEKLDAEYDEFNDAFTHFDTVSARIRAITALIPVAITPANQPTLTDRPAAMELYSQLNHRIAGLCPEPARSCVRSYETWQSCNAAGPAGKDCGPAPTCSAACPLTPEQSQRETNDFKSAVCKSYATDYATLIPDWTAVLKQEDAGKPLGPRVVEVHPADPNAPPANAGVAGMSSGMGAVGGVLAGLEMQDGIHSRPSCAVAPSYQIAQSAFDRAAHPVVLKGLAQPSAKDFASYRISQVPPIYPPLAKAAHISGTVTISATISKEGDVTQLNAIDGPDLLRSAAVDAVRQWKYRPYLVDGKPVVVNTFVYVNFNFGAAAPTPKDPAQH